MTDLEIGDQVRAVYGTLPLVGTVVAFDEAGRVLVRFGAVQQDWYQPEDLALFEP